jgi:hypothetical protein
MRRTATASALAIVAMTGQVWADITPQQVWDDFNAYMQTFGYSMTATETMTGSTLTVTDLSMIVPIPEEEGASIEIVVPQLTYTGNGDGSVTVAYPESSDIAIFGLEDDETVAEIIVTMTHSNFAVNVSGVPGDMTYTYAGDEVALELASVFADGEDIPADMLSASMSMGPLQGTSHVMRSDGLRSIEQDISMGALAYEIQFNDPDGEDDGRFAGQFSGLTSSGTTVLPEVMDYEDPTAMFRDGGAVDVVIAHAGGSNSFSVTDFSGTTDGMLSSSGGEFGIAFSEQELTYAISATDQTVMLTGPDLPLPINAELGEAGFALIMPLMASDTPQEASLSVVLGDFVISDMLWNIFDPAEILARGPATVAFNLAAEVTPFVSLLDTDRMEEIAFTGEMPGELNSVTLTDFVVDMIGGTILGDGAFTFDNSDLESFDGLPRPMGALNLQVAGANGLIDNLIAMGMLPEQDAMGMRMMLGMFTVPGEAPDTATSTIEINAEGHILANGQRIQ